ncbi:MAG TPA: hypothetical protein VIW47_11015 [Nitrospiraceae bacterium]|jgi:translation initiation factor IF-1
MISLLKKTGIFACSLLCLSVSGIAYSGEKMGDTESVKVIRGEVLRIEGPNYFVKSKENGKEVRLRIDKNTQMNAIGVVTGDKVVAKMDDQHHVLSILPDQTVSK